ncbi:uncharacterized protein crc [Panulirus ornatus]|uniref:uncharacterized protein crc n=1 Tax=Panulirus ornatus TaxID=150431 RepID=UPI003A889978
MEYNWMSDLLAWPSKGEQDFSLGAKTTSYQPPATESNVIPEEACFELPDWMESRENLGLTNIKLFDDIAFSQNIETNTSFHDVDVDTSVNDEYSTTIKPEDMFVPLSELKPQIVEQKDLPATPSATSSPQKIIICTKRVTVPAPASNGNNSSSHGEYQSLSIGQSFPQPNKNLVQNVEVVTPLDASTGICDADNLINEVVQKIGNEADMEDLLSQLETSCSQVEFSDVSSWGSEPASPVSFPSPVPSAGSLSPTQSVTESLFHSLLLFSDEKNNVPAKSPSLIGVGDPAEKCSTSEVHSFSHSLQKGKSCTVTTPHTLHSEDGGACKRKQDEQSTLQSTKKKKWEDDELLSVPSPVPSAGSLSPSQSMNDSFFHSLLSPGENKDVPAESSTSSVGDSAEEWSHSEVHSYSRLPRKSKSSRKVSSARSVPYPEDRRARKKEQNKQAALRYRQKKKQEDDDLLSKIKTEEEKQKQLKARYSNLKQELTYLKKIMREVFIAKGILSEESFKKK